MGKKKRQGDPSRDDCESTDEDGDPDDKNLSSCPHVGKAASLAAVKKTLKIAWVKVGHCTICIKENKVISPVKKLNRDPKKNSTKVTMVEIRREQLERAKLEQRAAAEKLKKDRELKNEESKPASEKLSEISLEKEKKTEEVVVEEPPKPVETPSIWMCLKCGTQGCGNNSKKHSFVHYKAPRSDLHCLVVNIESWDIWCYECQTEIYVDSHKKLYEVVEYIKKIKLQGSKPVVPMAPRGSNNLSFGAVKPLSSNSSNHTTSAGLPLRVKGLGNLGNTCFFNSVMQCLNQTHILTHLLDLQAAKGVSFKIPGVEASAVSTNDDSEGEVEYQGYETFAELNVQLAEGGPMVTSLAAFFKEMHNQGKTTSFSPSHLFTQVVKQAPKFRGMQQQDSHELLRYLMDGLRNEEQKRQKSAILKYFGLNEKTDPKDVARSLRHKLKVYGRQANHTLLDKIFSGQLVSTIVCEECGHSSLRYEQFLDISLPVVEDKPHKPAKKTTMMLPDDVEGDVTCCGTIEDRKTKSLSKKEKRKNNKNKKGRKKMNNDSGTQCNVPEVGNKIKEELQGNGKFENVELMPVIEDREKVITNTGFHRMESVDWKDEKLDEEEGYEEGEEEGVAEGDDWEWDYGASSEDKQIVRQKAWIKNDKEQTYDASEQDLYLADDLVELNVEHEKSSERTRENSENELKETGASSNGDVEDNDEDDSKKKWVVTNSYLNNFQKLDDLMDVSDNLDPHMESLCKGMSGLGVRTDSKVKVERERLEIEWTARTLTGLAPRYQAAPGECSVYSCLNSFTQSELLTGTNKWACDKCTEIKAACKSNTLNSSDPTGKKKCDTVYSSASKQMLVFSPPAVLTLQLKRFQQTISGCKKVNRHVTFPLDLDLAAFCSSTCVVMPSMDIGEKRVLYSLYGVVEHSGSLRGGHYVAYVKVRPADFLSRDLTSFFNPPLAKTNDVLNFLVEIDRKLRRKQMTAIEDSNNQETEKDVNDKNSSTSVNLGPRKWFHVSDSSVTEVNEDKVLRSQAYLLFYERTL